MPTDKLKQILLAFVLSATIILSGFSSAVISAAD